MARKNTFAFQSTDSYTWQTIFPDYLEQNGFYYIKVTMNNPETVKFSLCTSSVNDYQVICTLANSFICGFKVKGANTFLRARSADSNVSTSNITVELYKLSGTILSDIRNNSYDAIKLLTANEGLPILDVTKAPKYSNGYISYENSYVSDGKYKGVYHVGYVYDVSSFVGKKIWCYATQKGAVALYAFVNDYTLISSSPESSFATNVLEMKVGDNNILGSVFEVTVPTGANQLILCGADAEPSVAVVLRDNQILSKILSDISNAVNSLAGLESSIEEIKDDVYEKQYFPLAFTKEAGVINNTANGNVGYWTVATFLDGQDVREVPLSGTKYITKIFDVREYVGKSINVHCVPRNNQFGILFVTDYTLIPNAKDLTIWNSIYIGSVNTLTRSKQDHIVPVPTGSVYLLVVGSDLDPANVYYVNQESLEHRVNELESNFATDIVTLNDKDKTLFKILNAKREGRSGSTLSGITPLILLHFSDIHQAANNLLRIKEFYTYYKSYINDVICTGDMIAGDLTEGSMQFWEDAGVGKFLMSIGNHDSYQLKNPTQYATSNDVYNTSIKDYVESWGVQQPTDAEADGLCYYYKDYSDSHIRMIVLDPYEKSNDANYISDQNSWLQDVLEDARTNNLAVLCIIHQLAGNTTTFKCAFNAYQKGYSTSSIPSAFSSSVNGFITAGGEFIGWLGGHTHIDVCGVDGTYSNQVKIAIDTASQYQGSNGSDTYRSNDMNLKSYDCFNLVAIDVYQKLIKVIRIGADIDSWMRHKDMMTIQYASSSTNPIEAPAMIYPYE